MTSAREYLYQALEIDTLAEILAQDNHPWAEHLPAEASAMLDSINHGSLEQWLLSLKNAPRVQGSRQLAQPTVNIQSSSKISPQDKAALLSTLHSLKPWRKGPYELFGIQVDSEWRSDKKWTRIQNHIDLSGKRVLDVGCANGYFGWRMLDAGAKFVLGIDPGLLFIIQFLLINQSIRPVEHPSKHFLLPYRLEDLPKDMAYFDQVFSMGVLYHRRSLFDHLFELKQCLKPGGELVLETLVVPSEYGEMLIPRDRYARMRNVWFIPSTQLLCDCLLRSGFVDPRVIDERQTQIDEQRKTEWIDSQSLEDCLDPNNANLSIEGYPAPRRAIVLAQKPA